MKDQPKTGYKYRHYTMIKISSFADEVRHKSQDRQKNLRGDETLKKVDIYIETSSTFQGATNRKMWICPLSTGAQ